MYVRWPYDKRLDAAHAWGVLGTGVAFLIGLPSLLFTEHTSGPFEVWWPTDWMALPLAACVAGLLLLVIPVRRSALPVRAKNRAADEGDRVVKESTSSGGGQLRSTEVGALADLLWAIPDMRNSSFRQEVYNGVPQAVMQQVRTSDKVRFELISLIHTFSTFQHLRPWEAFLKQLTDQLPESPAVSLLAVRLRELGLVNETAPPGTTG